MSRIHILIATACWTTNDLGLYRTHTQCLIYMQQDRALSLLTPLPPLRPPPSLPPSLSPHSQTQTHFPCQHTAYLWLWERWYDKGSHSIRYIMAWDARELSEKREREREREREKEWQFNSWCVYVCLTQFVLQSSKKTLHSGASRRSGVPHLRALKIVKHLCALHKSLAQCSQMVHNRHWLHWSNGHWMSVSSYIDFVCVYAVISCRPVQIIIEDNILLCMTCLMSTPVHFYS